MPPELLSLTASPPLEDKSPVVIVVELVAVVASVVPFPVVDPVLLEDDDVATEEVEVVAPEVEELVEEEVVLEEVEVVAMVIDPTELELFIMFPTIISTELAL